MIICNTFIMISSLTLLYVLCVNMIRWVRLVVQCVLRIVYRTIQYTHQNEKFTPAKLYNQNYTLIQSDEYFTLEFTKIMLDLHAYTHFIVFRSLSLIYWMPLFCKIIYIAYEEVITAVFVHKSSM